MNSKTRSHNIDNQVLIITFESECALCGMCVCDRVCPNLEEKLSIPINLEHIKQTAVRCSLAGTRQAGAFQCKVK